MGSGLILEKLGLLLLVCLLIQPVSIVGLRVVVIVEILFLVVHLLLLLLLFCLARFSRIGGLLLIWLFVLSLIMGGGSLGSLSLFVVLLFGLPLGCLLLTKGRGSKSVQVQRVWGVYDELYSSWTVQVSQPVKRAPLWPASWLPALDKTRGSKSVEVQRVWEIYNERLQFMSRQDASLLDESLGRDDVSLAWSVWSRAAESALADAFQFSGGPLPSRGLVLGWGAALFCRVQLGGH